MSSPRDGTEEIRSRGPVPDKGLLMLSAISGLVASFHIVTSLNPGYGFFIDELYYFACSDRLAFGYVDHPPLSIVLLAFSRSVFGDSVVAIRIFPAVASGATVFVTGMIVRRLGGSALATAIAALAVAAMPVYLLMGSFFSMNIFEILIWTAILYYVVRLLQEESPVLWVPIGLLTGIGLEMKHTMIVYAAAVVIGLLLTSSRRLLWNRWFALSIAACIVLVIPNLWWQWVHGFPSLEFYRNAMINKNIPTGPLDVVLAQILFANPVSLPLWILGSAFLLFSKRGSRYRPLGVAFAVLLGVMVLSQSSRPDRIAAMYTVLFAFGAVEAERLILQRSRRIIPALAVGVLAVGWGVFAPVATPVLSPPALEKYLAFIGFSHSVEAGKANERLPQWIADRLGWEELARTVGKVYRDLPPEEQGNCVILSTNYGPAGAVELYREEFGLPPLFATHNSYHMWGPPADSVRTYIAVFVSRADLEKNFESVTEAAVQTCEYCTRPQRSISIFVARGPKFRMSDAWAGFRSFF